MAADGPVVTTAVIVRPMNLGGMIDPLSGSYFTGAYNQ
jgi:hypothetical protein